MRSVNVPTTSLAPVGGDPSGRGRGVGRGRPPAGVGGPIGRRLQGTSRVEVAAHAAHEPLQAGEVLVHLAPVVTPEHDVEPWGAEGPVAPVSRHRSPLPNVAYGCPSSEGS